MKTRFFTSLLASIALLLGVGGAQAQNVTWTGEAPAANTSYYMKNVGTGKYANGIDATVDAIKSAKAFAFTGSDNNWKIAGVSYTTSLTRDYAISSTQTNAWKNYSVTANGPFVFYAEKTAVFDDNYFFHLTQNVNFSYGSAGIPREVVKNDVNYQWNLISQAQYNAVYPTPVSGKAVSRTYESYENAVSTEKDGGIWLAKVATSRTGDYLATKITGLTNGYYYVTVSAKKEGAGAATVDVYNAAGKYGSEDISTTVNSYKILVNVTDGTATVKFNAGANVTNIAAAVTDIELFTVAANGSVGGRWIPEAPAKGNFIVCSPSVSGNNYMQENSTSLVAENAATILYLSAANNATIKGVSKYLYGKKNNNIWNNNSTSWKIALNSNSQYFIYSGNANTKGNVYMNGTTLTWGDNTSNNRLWQFISKAQYCAVYPQDTIRALLNDNTVTASRTSYANIFTEKEGSEWLAKVNATTAGDYLKLTIGGLTAGDIYTFDIDAKHLASLSAIGTLYVKSGSTEVSEKLSGSLETHKLSVVVDASKSVDIYVKTTVANSGLVYLAIKNITKTTMPKPVAFTVSGWTEVTSLTTGPLANPGQYFFSIWSDANTCLTLGSGVNGGQGAGYKTMKYSAGVNPDNVKADLAALWEFYKVSDGKYAIANASDREHILQAENGYFRYADGTPINVADATMTLTKSASANNWNFQASNGKNLTKWGSYNDVQLVDVMFSYYKIYAISRADYYALTQKIKYNATTLTPIDVSLFLANPEGLGTSGVGSTMLGWTNSGSLYTSEDGNYAGKNGKSYFGYYSEDVVNGQPTGSMTQTISGLPKGYYVLSVNIGDVQSGAELFMGSLSESFDSKIDNVVSVSGSVENDGGSLKFGVRFSDYQPHVDASEQPYKYQIGYDKFVLTYYGTDEVLAETVGEGEYYIRTNVGTDANPEYRYLEAGGNSTWGTEPVIGDHGFAYKLEKNGTKAGGVQLYALNSFIKEKTASQYFNGYFNDRNKDRSLISFIPVDAVNKPLDYRIYTERNVISDGTVCEAGYLYPKNNNTELGVKADNSGATVWQVVNELQRIKEMANASMSNPVDATFFIKDPDFSRNDTRSGYWKVGNNAADTLKHTNDTQYSGDYSTTVGGVKFVKGDNGNNNTNFNVKIQANKGAFDLRQKIHSVNLPTGIYRISAQGAAGNGGNVTLYATDGSGNELGSVAFDTKAFNSQKEAADEFNKGTYKKTIEVVVKENGLVVGFRGTSQTATSYVDNVEMYYLGEVPMDPSNIADNVDMYVYNVEAGQYLAETTANDGVSYAIVSNTGKLWTIEPKKEAGNVVPGLVAFRNGTSYLEPYNTTGTAIGYQTLLVAGAEPYYWSVTENDGFVTIKDEKGRLLEWNGDKIANVLSGTINDAEPRGTRWQFFTKSQYGMDRAFANNASTTRMANWPIVRAAKVNMKNLTGASAIEGLEAAYNALDAVWANSKSSAAKIAAVADELKSKMTDAMDSQRGSIKEPIDVSFKIANANLGDGYDGWTQNSASKWAGYIKRAATIYPNKTDVINVGAFGWGVNPNSFLKQTIDLPAGTYKVAVDIRSRSTGGEYVLSATAANGNVGSVASDGLQKMSIQTVISSFVSINDEDPEKSLEINLQLLSGSIAFDNFKLYYCGPAIDAGGYDLINEESELVLKGNWDIVNYPELVTNSTNGLKKVIDTHKTTLSTITVDGSSVNLIGTLNFDEILPSAYNILVYTDVANITGTQNIVRKESEGQDESFRFVHKCSNLVLTDSKQLNIPQEFTADRATYTRAYPATAPAEGYSWGTIILPFDVTKRPEGLVNFYDVSAIKDNGNLLVTEISDDGSLAANTPAISKATAAFTVVETNVDVHKTSEIKRPDPEHDDLCLYGNYTTKYVVGDGRSGNTGPNADGLKAEDCYYIKSNQFKLGVNYFNIGPFRSFIYAGKDYVADNSKIRPTVLSIDDTIEIEDETITSIDSSKLSGNNRYYNVRGERISTLQPGINIVVMPDGSTKKVLVK